MEDKFKLTIKQLKKNSNTAVYNALLAIRSKYIKEEDGVAQLRQYGGLQLLLYHLQRPNHKIIELALSILGNCCLEQETRTIVRRSDGIKHIVHILESLDKDSILNRACRTLANLALDDRSAEEIHSRNAAKSLLHLLKSTVDINLKLSALRAVRILANAENHREKINELGGTECLGKLLIVKYDCNQSDVLHSILRGLATLTTECTSECARQMQNVEYLERLVSCAGDTTALIRETTLHILANLMKQETLRPALGSAGVVTVLIAEVAKWEKSSSGWQWAVDAFCQCTREAVNRVRVRTQGGLKHLVSLLNDEDDERLWLCSLSSIVNFLYDDTSFVQLIDLGLAFALVNRFELLASRENQVVHNLNTLQNTTSAASRSNTSEHPLSLSVNAQRCANPLGLSSQMSPQIGCFSPDCSPPYWTSFPPLSFNLQMSPSCFSPKSRPSIELPSLLDEFCYSPVFEFDDSEDEMNSKEDSTSSKETGASLRELDSPCALSLEKNDELKEDGYDSDRELIKTIMEGRSPLGDILLLFSRLSMQENPCASFLKSGAFLALVNYVSKIDQPQPRARRCIFRAVRNSLCFEHLILQRMPSYIYDTLIDTPHVSSDCSVCSSNAELGLALITDLRLQAESSYGCGVILHLLLGKSDNKQKIAAAVAAAFLLRSSQVRRKVFVDSVGLATLTNALEQCETDEFDGVIKGLSFLAKSVFKLPEFYDKSDDVLLVNGCQFNAAGIPVSKVLLCVDDEKEGILADRHFLSLQSEFFRAMLSGDFIESNQEKIVIRDTSFKALECLVHYLHSCKPDCCPTLNDVSNSVTFLLEILVLVDKFILLQLREAVMDKIITNRHLSDSDYAQILSYSKLYDWPQLNRWTYMKILTSEWNNATERWENFREVFSYDDCNAILMNELSVQT